MERVVFRLIFRVTLGAVCVLPCYGALPLYSAMAVDRSGNIWVIGTVNSGDASTVPVTANAFQPNIAAGSCGGYTGLRDVFVALSCDDAFVIELDPSGTRVLYATFLGGHAEDVAVAIAASPAGGVYVTGYSSSIDFPVTSGVVQTQNKGPLILVTAPENIPPQGDVFVTKFNQDGSVAYSTLLGGTGTDVPVQIQADSVDCAYVAGYTYSTDFPLTPSPLSSAVGPAFLAKLNPTGTALQFSTYFPNAISGLAVDAAASPYVTWVNTADAYVGKISAAGNRFVYTTDLGGPWAPENGLPIVVDSHGQAWVWGPNGRLDSLIRIAPDGSSTPIPSVHSDSQYTALAIDADDNVYATGGDPQVQTTPNAIMASDCFTSRYIIELTSAGELIYASYLRQDALLGSLWVTAPGQVLFDATMHLDLTAPPPPLNFGCPVNGASFVSNGIAPGEIVSVFGYGLGPQAGVAAQVDQNGQIPTTLAGVQVLGDGVPLPLLYAQYGQVNIIMPGRQEQGIITIQVLYNGQSAPPLGVPPNDSNPGVFAVLNQDGSVNSPANPAAPGSIIQTFVTGLDLFGTTIPTDGTIVPIAPLMPLAFAPSVHWFGFQPADVTWAGLAPGLVLGVEQVNILIPLDIIQGTAATLVPLTFVGSPTYLVSADTTVGITIAQ
jgi:uncharacterized protein (TIGR03437 family)